MQSKRILILISLVAVLVIPVALAWNPPTGDPTTGNTTPPINESASNQVKLGRLTVGAGSSVTVGLMVPNGKVGIGFTDMSDVLEKLHVNGKIRGIQLCINESCKSAWIDSVKGGAGISTSPAGGSSGNITLNIQFPSIGCNPANQEYMKSFNLTTGVATCVIIQ